MDSKNAPTEATPEATPDDPVLAPPTPATPTEPMHGYWPDYPNAWLETHHRFVAEAQKGEAQVVFLGDSITQGWGANGKSEWDKRFAPLGAVNFGIGGDRTQQILWRVEHGTLDGLSPKIVVLKIGVNNLWGDLQEYGEEKVADGIEACVRAIRRKVPGAKVLLLGILPTKQQPDNPLRLGAQAINARSAKLADDDHVFFRDLGEAFLEPDGTISPDVMPDYLHLSPEGYRRFADALEPVLRELLR